jgi:hypothetical protein
VRAILFAAALALFLSATAEAQVCGPVTAWGAHPGDTVTGDWTLDRAPDNGREFLRSDGGQPEFDGGHSCGTCGWSMITTIDNPSFWTDGPSSARCHYDNIAIIPAVMLDLVALSPEAKAEAQWWSDGLDRTRLFTTTMATIVTGYCAIGLIELCPWAGYYFSVSRAAAVLKDWADLYVKDPFTDQYPYPYDPPVQTPADNLGINCGDDATLESCNYAAWHAAYAAQWWDGAYESANRANSCAQVGNKDCFNWQRDRMNWFTCAAGVETEAVAYGSAQISDYSAAVGFPTDVVEGSRDISASLYDISGRMKAVCGW